MNRFNEKETCDGSGFTFKGTDGKDYGYNGSGQPCQINTSININVGNTGTTGLQNSVLYNSPTLLSSNSNSNTATFQPLPPLVSTSLFGSSGGGYLGVAESHSFNNPHGGIHSGTSIHGKYVEPKPQKIQPVQTVINTTQPVVKQEVVITKPVLTQKEIKAEADAWEKPFIEAKISNIKAKAIVQKIVDVQKTKDKVLDLSNNHLTYADMKELMNEVRYVNFDLDVISLENTQFDLHGSLSSFMRIFTVHDKDVFHNVVYLNLANIANPISFFTQVMII